MRAFSSIQLKPCRYSGQAAKLANFETHSKHKQLAEASASCLMEAAGIEPASRGTSVPVSTCVADICLSSALMFAFPCPGRQGRGSAIGQVF